MDGLTRRGLLAGLMAGATLPAFAKAPVTSVLPRARPKARTAADAARSVDDLVAAAGLSGDVTFVLADLASGGILAARGGDRPMPPASTAKTITSLYALDHLGRDYRFGTRLVATGPVAGGRIAGDLVLAGGGDPTLSTDDLGDLAAALAAAGIRGVSGRFLVWPGALPYLERIDPAQPVWMGYDPAVSGLNLNFNRVNLTWQKTGGAWRLGFDARAERFAPAVNVARIEVVAREHPLFTYAERPDCESWTVAQAALGKTGSRWLPVRRPALYAGDVFRTLAAAQGIGLPPPTVAPAAPQGQVLARHDSAALPLVLREMLKYSTNMTAEAAGMTASAARGIVGHEMSARAMTDWLAERIGGLSGGFADHSGLGAASRVSAADMARALVRLGPGGGLGDLMKPVRLPRPAAGEVQPRRAMAKTGTLNFVSGLVGYLTTASGQERAFAIYAADMARHDAVSEDQMERPPGLSAWLGRARRLQLQLLQSWA